MSAVLQPVGDIERHLYIGSGDAASIMRVSKWRTRLDTYLAKVEPQKSNLADPDRERIFRRGHKLEPYILEMLVDALRDAGHQVEFAKRLNYTASRETRNDVAADAVVSGDDEAGATGRVSGAD